MILQSHLIVEFLAYNISIPIPPTSVNIPPLVTPYSVTQPPACYLDEHITEVSLDLMFMLLSLLWIYLYIALHSGLFFFKCIGALNALS